MSTYSSNTTIAKYSCITNNGSFTGTSALFTIPAGYWFTGTISVLPSGSGTYVSIVVNGVPFLKRQYSGSGSGSVNFDLTGMGSDSGALNVSTDLLSGGPGTFIYSGTLFKNTP